MEEIPLHFFSCSIKVTISQIYQITIFSHLIKYANHNSFIPIPPHHSHKYYIGEKNVFLIGSLRLRKSKI